MTWQTHTYHTTSSSIVSLHYFN